MLSKKVFLAGEPKFSAPPARPARAKVRDHIGSQESDHRASYMSCGGLQQRKQPKTDFREILRAAQFSTFSTASVKTRPSLQRSDVCFRQVQTRRGIRRGQQRAKSRLPRCKKSGVKARHAAPTAIGCRSSRRRSLMQRREFIAGLESAAVAWPLTARPKTAAATRQPVDLQVRGEHPHDRESRERKLTAAPEPRVRGSGERSSSTREKIL
jgi:hypothetical protein